MSSWISLPLSNHTPCPDLGERQLTNILMEGKNEVCVHPECWDLLSPAAQAYTFVIEASRITGSGRIDARHAANGALDLFKNRLSLDPDLPQLMGTR